ncbi:hypothetical protein FACS1894208_02350 [Clostridia bacterium]|nr:hypothetical protein FACS1894208_02350 [Clostridia bacterium]
MRILVYGDIHLSSRKRTNRNNYPDESLHYFKFVTEQAEQLDVDCIVGLGDFSYGDFNNLKFRAIVEELLDRQVTQTHGERYELQGNHDISNVGLSERDFYVERGKIKEAKGSFRGEYATVSLLNYGDAALYSSDGGQSLETNPDKTNIVLCHDFLRFQDSKISGYGNAGYTIEGLPGLNGVDWFVCGHIHDMLSDRSGGRVLFYPGAMARPVAKGAIMEKAALVLIDTDSADDTVQIYEVELLPVEESFDLQRIARGKADKEYREELTRSSGELRDAVRGLTPDGTRRTALDIIRDNRQVTIEVRDKAMAYLTAAGSSARQI